MADDHLQQSIWRKNGISMLYRTPRKYDVQKVTIVMFHSFLMDSCLFNPQFEDPVYEEYNLIAIDEHGHGGTTGRECFTFWSTAEDSLELLTDLGVSRFYILGTSQGGFVAMRIALLAPERTYGLILLGTNALAESKTNIEVFRASRDKWCAEIPPSEEALDSKTNSFGGWANVSENTKAMITKKWIARHAGPQGYDPALNCLCDRDSIFDRLREIVAPVLVMHGTRDSVYSESLVKSWAHEFPNLWNFIMVEGGHHYLSFVRPGVESCRDHITRFIADTIDFAQRRSTST